MEEHAVRADKERLAAVTPKQALRFPDALSSVGFTAAVLAPRPDGGTDQGENGSGRIRVGLDCAIFLRGTMAKRKYQAARAMQF